MKKLKYISKQVLPHHSGDSVREWIEEIENFINSSEVNNIISVSHSLQFFDISGTNIYTCIVTYETN